MTIRLSPTFPTAALSEPLDLRLTLEGNREWTARIPTCTPALVFSSIGFSESLNKLFLYVRNSGEQNLRLQRILLSMEDITHRCQIPEPQIGAGETKLIVAKPSRSLIQGELIGLKVTTREGASAQSLVRAFRHFPISIEYGRDRVVDREGLLCDAHPYEWHSDGQNDHPTAYHLLDCPMHMGTDRSIQARNRRATDLLANIGVRDQEAPFTPGYTHICKTHFYQGCACFGQAADIVRINPSIGLLPILAPYIPNDIDSMPMQYLTEIAKVAAEPRPVHTVISVTNENPDRLNPTPELLRWMVYQALSRGAKGIFYRDFGDSLKERPEVQQEMRHINAELRVLKPFLMIGEHLPLAHCTDPEVEAAAILAGDRGIVLLLLNRRPIKGLVVEDGYHCSFWPREDFEVRVDVPPGMAIQDLHEVGGPPHQLAYEREGAQIAMRIDRLDLTRQILLTTDTWNDGGEQTGPRSSERRRRQP